MLQNIISEPQNFREATEDLVKTIQEAVQQNELSSKDREWLIDELDELIEGLKLIQIKLVPSKTSRAKKRTIRVLNRPELTAH